jgi:beta-fructofuranosidase
MRPQFHFTGTGWINDPHGLTFSGSRYHLFFQYVPGSTTWGLGCSWGHAIGDDLVSFVEAPTALMPGEGDDGIWSGSLSITADGSPRILYTSVSESSPALGRIRSATTSDPDWIRWDKGPVVAEAPPGIHARAFRDPVVLPEGDTWRMIVGAALAGGTAAAVGFSSPDGIVWHEGGIVASRSTSVTEPVWSGSMWECPQIIDIDGRHVLIVSVWDADVLYDVLYSVGRLADGVFEPGPWRRLTYGPSPYAATAFRDRDGRACLMFWLRGIAGPDWAGAHSIPYRMTLHGDTLSLSPHPDLERYHRDDAAGGSAADILWPQSAGAILQISSDGGVPLSARRRGQDLLVQVGDGEYRVPWEGDIRIIIDGPIVEIVSDAGLFAAPSAPLGDEWELTGPGIRVRPLRRQVQP